jgi:hypothetical protein
MDAAAIAGIRAALPKLTTALLGMMARQQSKERFPGGMGFEELRKRDLLHRLGLESGAVGDLFSYIDGGLRTNNRTKAMLWRSIG